MIPILTIVGRPNVGKSSLLNALARRRISIVDPTPGVTRDRVSVMLELGGRSFELVDTGGIGIVDAQHLEDHVEEQIDIALETADLILFVVDGRDGITKLDHLIAERLRKVETPVLLLANKIDVPKLEADASDFYRLGFETVLPVSATQGRGLPEFLEHLETFLKENPFPEPAPDDPAMKLAILGKRNSGKSTLVNTLAGDERVIVSETPGTTRDAVDIRFQYKGKEFLAIDTAGVRKRKAVENSIEFYSQARSLSAIRRGDVVLLLIEAPAVTSQVDKKLADAIVQSAKPIVVGINKWDLSGAVTTEEYVKYVRDRLPGLAFAPVTFLSAKTGKNVWRSLDLLWDLYEQSRTRVETWRVNEALEKALEKRRPPLVKGRKVKLFYATQVDVAPPTIVIFVNDPSLVQSDYKRYLANRFREELPYPEIPLKLIFRAREKVELPKRKPRRRR